MAQGKLGANLVSNVAFFGLNIVVSLWLVSYLVRQLGVAAYGLVPLAVTVAGYFNVITAGLNAAVGRHLTVAMSSGDQARANSIFNSSLWASVLVGPSSSGRSRQTTWAPSAARMRAVDSPIPRAAPVTTWARPWA